MNSNPYFRWAASWIGFAVGVIVWGIIVSIVGIMPLYAWVYAAGSVLMTVMVLLILIVVGFAAM